MDMWSIIATERRRLAGELEQLTDAQWATQSQCEAWDVRHMAAHLLLPFEFSMPKFMFMMAKVGFDFDKFALAGTAHIASTRTNAEIIQGIRDIAEDQWTPPGKANGVEVPFGEIIVHGHDIRNPLGIANQIDEDIIEAMLAATKDDEMRADYRRRVDCVAVAV